MRAMFKVFKSLFAVPLTRTPVLCIVLPTSFRAENMLHWLSAPFKWYYMTIKPHYIRYFGNKIIAVVYFGVTRYLPIYCSCFTGWWLTCELPKKETFFYYFSNPDLWPLHCSRWYSIYRADAGEVQRRWGKRNIDNRCYSNVYACVNLFLMSDQLQVHFCKLVHLLM